MSKGTRTYTFGPPELENGILMAPKAERASQAERLARLIPGFPIFAAHQLRESLRDFSTRRLVWEMIRDVEGELLGQGIDIGKELTDGTK